MERARVPRRAARRPPLPAPPARTASALVGYAGLGVRRRRRRSAEAEIHTIGVDPAHQRRGIGRALLRGLLAVADAAGATVFLEVRTDNEAARALYEAEGFTVVGLRRRYYRPSGADAYTMRREPQADDRPRDRDLLRRDRGRHRARSRTTARVDAAGQRGRLLASTSTPASAAWCPRWRRGRTCRRWCPPCTGRSPPPGSPAGTSTRSRSPPGPGLTGALLVGVAAAKAYAAAWDVPLYGVNHLAAHVAVDTLQHGPLPPCLALLVSGGHSSLLDVPDLAGPVTPLGATIDDAAGEAFDKVARLLGLPFPGGPHIDRVARDGDPAADRVPARPHRPARRAVRLLLLRPEDRGRPARRGAGAGGHPGPGGRRGGELPGGRGRRAHGEGRARGPRARDGHAAARRRRGGQLPAARAGPGALRRRRASTLRVPRPGLCTDNGAMVAALGAHLLAGRRDASPARPARRLVAAGHRGAGRR